MKKMHICVVCGKEFIPKRYDSKVCSKECLKHFSSKKYPIKDKISKCLICGKEFIKVKSNQKTCCRECGDKFRLNNYKIKAENKESFKKERKLYIKYCKYCGNEFNTFYNHQLFCCSNCYELFNKKPKKQYNNKCLWCGKNFISNRKSNFCCKSCYRSSYQKGVLHHRPYKINNSSQNRIYRNIIGERDNWICNICGEKIDKNLKYPNPMSASLDHIIPLSKGGQHSYDNVHIAHLYCNCVLKKDKL